MSRGRRIARIKFVLPSPAAAEKYLLEWDNRALFHNPENFPSLSPENLFNHLSPMVLEIGCGTGEFLLDSATRQPHINFVGVEISRRAVYHAVNQAEAAELGNLKFIKADIRLLYPLMEAHTWTTVHLIFPDPNYSPGRRKHRIFSPEFLDVFHTALTPNGKINVITDQLPFLEDMLQIVENDPRFSKTHTAHYLEDHSPDQKTRFQQAWERYQRPNYSFELGKSSEILSN
jgi:tRNA (guanine-N7-)-methyltransferase